VSAAFYTVADDRYFLGAAGLVNSLRLVGHDEPVHVLDCGLTRRQRDLLAPAGVRFTDGPRATPGNLLKTIAPLAHPADGIVLIDADIIVTQPLGELIERGRSGEVLAFGTGMDRFEPHWGELGMGSASPRPYLCSALVFCGGARGAEIVRLMDERRDLVDWERTYWRANDDDYPLVHADQDLFNAVLTTRVEPELVTELEGRLMAFPPFEGLRVADERTLRCVYGDGAEPYVLHHWNAKPWLEPSQHGPYSRLLRRLLLGDDVPVRVPQELIPLRLRSGPLAWADRTRVNASERLRWHVREPLAARVGRSARHEPGAGG
jgi:hypothetical protein